MATYQVPKNAGREFWIQTSRAGTPIVWNRKTGRNKLLIPGRDMQQAQQIHRKLTTGEHTGEIRA